MKGSAELISSVTAAILVISAASLFYLFPGNEERINLKSFQETDQALLESISVPILTSSEVLHPLPQGKAAQSMQSEFLILRDSSEKILVMTQTKTHRTCLSLLAAETELEMIRDALTSIRSNCKPLTEVNTNEFYVQTIRDPLSGNPKYVRVSLSYAAGSKTYHRNAVFPLLSERYSKEIGL